MSVFLPNLEDGGQEKNEPEFNLTAVIVGSTVPVVVIIVACISMILGYYCYKRSKKRKGEKNKKYRLCVT